MTPAEIREARKSLGLGQRDFARLLGYRAPTRVSEIETGAKKPSDSVVRLIRAYLGGYRPDDWPTGLS